MLRKFLRRRGVAVLVLVAYVGTVVAANWSTDHFGLVAAGLGLLVPMGTYTAGLALGLRDALQDAAGDRRLWWVLAAIGIGTGVSFWVSDPQIAFASGAAFLLAELLDLAVYTPLRDNDRRVLAVVVSNTAGAAADTWLFLWWAPFDLTGDAFAGQLLVKAGYCTAAYLLVRHGAPWAWRKVVRRRAVPRQPLDRVGA